MFAALLILGASAGSHQVTTFPMSENGVASSCATAFEGTRPVQSIAWALGFWSGLNVGTGNDVGVGTDPAGIVAEIKLDCSKHPSMKLSVSITQTWERLGGNTK